MRPETETYRFINKFKFLEVMKKKIIVCLLIGVITFFSVKSGNLISQDLHRSGVTLENIEALSESELSKACGGCSTEKTIYCCTVTIGNLGTYTLKRD